MTKEIPLTKGKVALVSDEDYERVSQFKWTATHSHGGTWYAYRAPVIDGKKTHVSLHQFILQPPEGFIPDHINRDGLDCRRENLRLATPTQNTWNRSFRKRSKTGYTGVVFMGKKFQATAYVSSARKHLGTYDDAEFAARVYDAFISRIRGEFAVTNFPDIDPSADEIARRIIENPGCRLTPIESASPYRGVTRCKASGKWKARIYSHGSAIWIGRFKTEEEAARAVDAALIELHGDSADLNFPTPDMKKGDRAA